MLQHLTPCHCLGCAYAGMRVGSGRRVGETCEQTWSLVVPTTKLTRYMSKANYLDCLDDALLVISDDKLGSSVTFFVSQHSAAVKKLGEAVCPSTHDSGLLSGVVCGMQYLQQYPAQLIQTS